MSREANLDAAELATIRATRYLYEAAAGRRDGDADALFNLGSRDQLPLHALQLRPILDPGQPSPSYAGDGRRRHGPCLEDRADGCPVGSLALGLPG